MKTNHSLETRLTYLYQIPILVFLFFSLTTFAQPPVASGDCGRHILEFDGVDDEVSVSIADFSYASGTMEAWVRKDNWQDAVDDALFSNGIGHGSSNSFYVSFHPAVGLHFRYGGGSDMNNSASYSSISSTNTLAANSWHHVAATWHNDGSTTTLAIYLDGTQIHTTTAGNLVLDGPTTFGISRGAFNSHYVLQGGSIAEMRVWDVARTETEIANNKNVTLTGSETGLIGYWPLNDGAGTSASNMVSEGALGTLVNMDAPTDWVSNFPISISAGATVYKDGDFDYGTQLTGSSSEAQVFTITNHGNSTIDLSTNPISALSGADAEQFSLDLSSTASSLTAGGSTTFTIAFTPDTEGVKNAAFSFASVSGCGDPYTFNLTGISSTLAASVTVDSHVTINGDSDGQLTVVASGGSEPYSYLWSNSATTATVSGLSAGTYSVQITDSQGATVQVSEEVTEPEVLIASIEVISNVSTIGGSDGELTATATGGVEPYSYSWNSGSTTANISGLPAGNYEVTITDDNGAVVQESITVTEPLLLQAGIKVVTNESAARNIGELSAYGIHGFPPYSYSWSNGASTQTISGLGEGTYTVTVTDSQGYEEEVTKNLTSDAKITYSGSGFYESYLNNGSVTGQLSIELKGDIFNSDDDVLDASEVNVNLPSGLNASIEITERTEIFDTLLYFSLDNSYTSSNWQAMTFGSGTFVALANSSGASSISSIDGVNWIAGDIAQQSWYSVIYENDKFVAVSGDGYSSVSTDGMSWSSPSFISSATYYDLAFGNGLFIAVASSGDSSIMVSKDGTNWVTPTSSTNTNLRSVTYGAGEFVALGYYGDILKSTDGEHWIFYESVLPSVNFQSIAYGDGTYVACSSSSNEEENYGGEIWSSTDGENWTQRTVSSSVQWIDVKYETGLFLAIGEDDYADNSGALFTSPDGVTWTDRQLESDQVSAMAYGHDRLVVFGTKYQTESSENSDFFISRTFSKASLTISGESVAHQNINDVLDITFEFNDVAFENSVADYVINGTGPSSSFIGINFIDNPLISYSGGFNETAADDGTVEGSIVLSLPGEYFQDEDEDNLLDIGSEVTLGGIPAGLSASLTITEQNRFGLDWNVSTTTEESLDYGMRLGAYGNGTYVALSYYQNKFAYSSDGESWTFGAVDYGYWGDLIFANELFVAVGEDYIMTSVNGIDWSVESTYGEWNGVTYGNGKFVAVESYGVMYSADGLEWTEESVSGSWEAVAFGNDIFVAVGTSSDHSMYSADGQNWIIGSGDTPTDARMMETTNASVINNSVYHIAFGGGSFVAIGYQHAYVSSDGVDWAEFSIPYGYWNDITYANGYFYIGGSEYYSDESVILRSSDGSSWESVDVYQHDINGFINGDKLLALTDNTYEWMLASSPSFASAELTLSGNATDHLGVNFVSDITFDFEGSAFGNLAAEDIIDATGPASSGLGITFKGVANDVCADAETLTVNAPGIGDYIDASTEFALSPESSISCAAGGSNKDIWYQFTMPASGSVEINTSLGTAKSLSGAVYTSCGSSSLFCENNLTDKIYLPIGPGVSVLIQFFSSEEDAGSFSIRINEAPNTWSNTSFGPSWSSGEAPASNDDALILSEYVIDENEALVVNDLELFNDGGLYGGTLIINNGSHVKINGDLTNTGGIVVQSGGSLVTMGEVTTVDLNIVGITFQGLVIVRNTTFDQNTGRYSVVGSPVQNGKFDSLGTGAVVYAYDESSPYNPSGNQGLNRYKTPDQLELPGMEPGVGYFSAFTGDESGKVIFVGTPNHGTVEVGLSYTDQGVTEEEPYEGYNLVSNPYPAAISVESFFDANSGLDMDAAVYIWDDYSSDTERGTNADYIVVNNLGNTSTNSRADGEERFDGNIRSAQGFFVKANSSGQTLQFTDAMKVTGNNSDAGYFRKVSTIKYKFSLSNDQESKATIIGYVSDATLGKDKSYDALHMAGGDLQFYTLMNSGEKLAIQGVPEGHAGEVLLGFATNRNTTHTIGQINVNEINQPIWLLDQYTGKSIDLTRESYTFTTEPGVFENRFTLRSATVLHLAKSLAQVYAFEKTLYIHSDSSEPLEFTLFDLSGMEVARIVAKGKLEVNLNHLRSGVYLISNGKESKKVVLK